MGITRPTTRKTTRRTTRPSYGFSFLRVNPPTNLDVAVDEVSGGLEISWTAADAAESYNLYKSVDGGPWESIATGITGTSYTYIPDAAGEYSFAVSSVSDSTESDKAEYTPSSLFDDVSDSEGIALMAFYEATGGDAWTDNTNWMTDSTVGNWFGVTVSGGSVTKLSLVDNNLNGNITDFQESEFGLGLDLELWDNANLTFSSRFIIKIKTDNVGDSADDTVVIPAAGDFEIDWGDGTVETYTGAAIDDGLTKHTYSTAGEYWVMVSDGLEEITYKGDLSKDKDKITEIRNWGDCAWTKIDYAYRGCGNLNMVASDIPDLSFVTTLSRLTFYRCLSIAASIKNWDVSVWDNMAYFFRESQFNQDLSEWQLSATLTDLMTIFRESAISTENYSRTLIGWANQVAANGGPYNVDMSGQIGCTYNNTVYGGSPYDNAVDARAFLTGATAGWTITEDSQV